METEGGFHAAFLQTRSGPDVFSAGILERRPSMSRQLKKRLLPGGVNATEKACGDYVCKYCGGRATACNFVANMCLQVYAAIRDCAGLIGKLKRIWAISRNVVPANFKGCPASACMRERQLWDDVSPTKRKVHQALY